MALEYIDLEISLSRYEFVLPIGRARLDDPPVAAAGQQPARPEPVVAPLPYTITARYWDPYDEAAPDDAYGHVAFDLLALANLQDDHVAYGRLLTNTLLKEGGDIRKQYDRARTVSRAKGRPLRLRLRIAPNAGELHTLRWETLCDPMRVDDKDPWLLAQDDVYFSRYLSSADWLSVSLGTHGNLKVLVVIANPPLLEQRPNPGGRELRPVDVMAEFKRAKDSLGDNIKGTLISGQDQVTLGALISRVQEGFDVLYLVCHGALVREDGVDVPHLWLETVDDEERNEVPATELVRQIRNMARPPVLVVLASCQSAGTGQPAAPDGEDSRRSTDQGVFAALGPQLVLAGVPAVLAMQGDVYMSTLERFMPVFFTELRRDGQVDRAVAVARGAIQREGNRFDDRWMPTLFMRLQRGRIWRSSPLAGDEPFQRWVRLVYHITRNKQTPLLPIVGPGLTQSLIGTPREIARQWAESEGFPTAALGRAELPQIAQYIATQQGRPTLSQRLIDYVGEQLIKAYSTVTPPDKGANAVVDRWAELDQTVRESGAEWNRYDDSERVTAVSRLITVIGRFRRAAVDGPSDPYKVLASLNLPVFITANYDNLLADALTDLRKEPKVAIFPWNLKLLKQAVETGRGGARQSGARGEKSATPTVQAPLVYHLFGHLSNPDSLVLTEDDYFDYMMAFSKSRAQTQHIPSALLAALAERPLLFVGFQMEDWQFRVLFRSILPAASLGASGIREPEASVAVQLDPGESEFWPRHARRYLESYFRGASVSMYWGGAQDFIDELNERMRQNGADKR